MNIAKFLGLLVAITAMALAGCRGESTTANEFYGHSSGYNGRTSLNGFGALRTSFENAGYDSRDVHRLNKRTSKNSVIVWTPQVLSPIPSNVTNWMDTWLKRGNRTLVYIIPDSGSSAKYWKEARDQAPAKQRMEYRRRLAREVSRRTTWQRNRNRIGSNGWFEFEPKPLRSDEDLTTEFVLYPYRDSKAQTTAAPTNTRAAQTYGPTGPNAGYTPFWETTVTETGVRFRPLRKTVGDHTIVAEVTSDQWKNSKVLVVAGGSLVTNYGFIAPAGVEIANQLVSESIKSNASTTSFGTAGFLTSSYSPIPISDKLAETSLASGMELLTVWPISLVTIHLTLLGFVVCMYLFPRFGRPKKIHHSGSSDFSDHLDAVAALMSKTKGDLFARKRISQYMRRIKGDTAGKWVLPETRRQIPTGKDASGEAPVPSAGTVSATPNDTATSASETPAT